MIGMVEIVIKNKKIPTRTCIITKQVLPKKDLIRVVLNKEGIISVDLTGKAHGRGAYVSSKLSNTDKDRIVKAFNKKFNTTITDEIYQEIIKNISNENE